MNFKFVLFMARKMFGAQVQRGNILLVVMVFGALAITTGWHPDRRYVEWQGVCPVGDAAPSLEVKERG